MTSKKCIPPTIPSTDRRPDMARLLENMDRTPPFHPDARMALHQASKAHRGPDPGSSVRMILRGKLGDEAKTVRGMYDRTVKPKRGRRS